MVSFNFNIYLTIMLMLMIMIMIIIMIMTMIHDTWSLSIFNIKDNDLGPDLSPRLPDYYKNVVVIAL